MDNKDTGLLLDAQNIKLHRVWFKQMTRLLGLIVEYRAPKDNTKKYDGHGELDSFYDDTVSVGCIYDDHPTQYTMKKLGWDTDLNDSLTIIHVPYDLKKLQVGSIFIIPSGLDNTEPKTFRVIKMRTSSIYPASIACELGPLFDNVFNKNNITDFTNSDLSLLDTSEEEGQ